MRTQYPCTKCPGNPTVTFSSLASTAVLKEFFRVTTFDFSGFFFSIGYNFICAMVNSRYIGDGHPTFNRNPYNGYINPYYWVDDHPILYGNNGSLDPGTFEEKNVYWRF